MRDLAGYFRALSEVVRLKIIQLLTEHEMCVCELVDRLGMSQPAVSHHLRVLKAAGLISHRRNGKWLYYFINGKRIIDHQCTFKDLALHAVEERTARGVPASPVHRDGETYCEIRKKNASGKPDKRAPEVQKH